MFHKVNGFHRGYDRTKYLVTFGPEKYDFIFYRIRFPIEYLYQLAEK